jgi:cell division septation protein DedD
MTSEPAHLVDPTEPTEPVESGEPEEFELVLGRRQVASVTFVVLVLLAVFSGVSYLAGKATPPRKVEAPVRATVPEPPPRALDAALVATAAPVEAPIFASPVPQAIYIQMGAVEKGIAVIFAEGLRKRGFDAFVAPGPNEKIYRVLVGPFRNSDGYQVAKISLEQIGLSTFARRYEQQ